MPQNGHWNFQLSIKMNRQRKVVGQAMVIKNMVKNGLKSIKVVHQLEEEQ